MKRSFLLAASFVLAASLALSAAPAQDGEAQSQASSGQRDPDAIAALGKMGESLRGLQNFDVHADVTREEVLTSGQKLQFGGTVDMKARRPDGLRVDIKSDRQERSLYYDGKTATLYSPRLGYYASFDAPPTIREVVALAADRYGIEVPMADLFTWGTDASDSARIQSAFRVGTETIGDRVCDHYAVRQDGVDWQIWIREGEEALPCKIVITTTDDPSMPQYSAVYDWSPGGAHAANTFTFTPPASARKIAFADVPTQGRSGGRTEP